MDVFYYFQDAERSEMLRSFKEGFQKNNRSLIGVVLVEIVDLMIDNPLLFDSHISLGAIGVEKFFDGVRGYLNFMERGGAIDVEGIFVRAFYILCEVDFVGSMSESGVGKIFEIVYNRIDDFPLDVRREILKAQLFIPNQVAKKLLNDPSMLELRSVAEKLDALKELNGELTAKINVTASLKKAVEKISSKYNFVGLNQGFQNLSKSKAWERRVALVSLIILSVCMIGLPFYQVWYVRENIDLIEENKWVLLYSLPGILAIEFLLIYFFRVVLSQFRSVKAQILQIELRKTLCQFIESYAEYSMKIKEKDPGALSKFEALVFSGLAPDNESIPSTFDGVEQLANLFKNIRG